MIEDSEAAVSEYEIVVGETSRDISARLDADCEGVQFAILAEEKQIALEGEKFVIAAAAYYFISEYVPEAGAKTTVPGGVSVHDPIVKEAKNFILLIGDGMGYYQTKMFDYMEDNTDFSDGEDEFYGYMLPYQGFSRTDSLSGTTDSAAGGTALATGYKTINGYIGMDQNTNDVMSLTELAISKNMGAAVMSTESSKGATPASFSAHNISRDNSDDILDDQFILEYTYGVAFTCNFNQYTALGIETIERRIMKTLDAIDDKDAGLFLMYEEAHIDKRSHDNDAETTYQSVIRFNQAIARFMEFAFYNPDTFVLITADHETGDLRPEEDGSLAYHRDGHSSADVPVFAYGMGAELFDGKTVENVQIAQTIAALMGEDNFGDQSIYQSLTK